MILINKPKKLPAYVSCDNLSGRRSQLLICSNFKYIIIN